MKFSFAAVLLTCIVACSTSAAAAAAAATAEKEKFLGPYAVCHRGAFFTNRCNVCFCKKDSLFYECTKHSCFINEWTRDQTPIVESEMVHRKNESDCTIMDKGKCVPSCLYYHYCNTCSCFETGGGYICTEENCDRVIWNRNGTLKIKPDDEVVGYRKICEPFSTVSVYCNQCRCSQEGSSYTCTKITCDENLYFINGTLKPVSPNAGDRVAPFFLNTYSIPFAQILYVIYRHLC